METRLSVEDLVALSEHFLPLPAGERAGEWRGRWGRGCWTALGVSAAALRHAGLEELSVYQDRGTVTRES